MPVCWPLRKAIRQSRKSFAASAARREPAGPADRWTTDMASFRWSAINPGSETASGVIEAADRAAAVERLQRQGRTVLRADPAETRRSLGELLHIELGGRRGIDRATLGEVTRELAIMLLAGQDLDRALRFVVDNAANARARSVLTEVRDKVRSGSSLAAALASEPQSFSRLYIGMVRAGEAGGTLPATLEQLAQLLERERSLKAGLRAAMTYPLMLVIAAIGSIVLLLDYVLPQFTPIFEQAGAQLPASTRLLMALGGAVGVAAPWLLVGILAAVLAARHLLARPANRLKLDRLLLRLPVAGGLLRETLAARLTRTLGSLLQNGVPLITALGIAQDALGNLAAAAAVEAAALGAKGGAGLARPLAAAGIFPARTIHLLQLGEEAAQRVTPGANDHYRDGPCSCRDRQRSSDGDAEPQ